MAPAGLLKREHAVDGSSWTRKRIHSKLGARSGAFLGLKSTGLSLGKNGIKKDCFFHHTGMYIYVYFLGLVHAKTIDVIPPCDFWGSMTFVLAKWLHRKSTYGWYKLLVAKPQTN
jgi:hypothetical protein